MSASTSKSPYGTVATTEVRYQNGETDSEECSDEEIPERWIAYPQDVQRVLNQQEELERVKEQAKKEQLSEQEIDLSTDSDSSDDASSTTYRTDGEEATAMTTPTSLRIPPFGGTPGENLNSFLRRFDRAVRWAVFPRYPAGEEGEMQKEMDMGLMIQDNLIGKALEESDAFPEAAYESVQAFKDALRQAFPQSEAVVTSKEDQRKVKALRFYETLSIIGPETGDRDPPELYVQRARWFRQYLPDTLHRRLAHLFLTCLHDLQLVYAIKSTIHANELTFDNVVERYQRCNATEWGQVVTLGPDETDALIRTPSATRVANSRPEETTENMLAQVVAEVMNRSIGAQEQMAQAMQSQSYQMARLIETVSTNPQPIPVTNTPPSTSTIPTLRLAPRIVPISTLSGESSGPSSLGSSSSGPSASGPVSSGITELRPAAPRIGGNIQAPSQGANRQGADRQGADYQGTDRQGRNVGFQPREFASTCRSGSNRQCFKCAASDHIASNCPPGTVELPVQEQQRLRAEWLLRTGRTAAFVAHTAISEEESDVESVDADAHISGWDTRRTPCMRMARQVDGTFDSESNRQGAQQVGWRWAFELGKAAAVRAGRNEEGSDVLCLDSGLGRARSSGKSEPVWKREFVNVTEKLDGKLDAVKKGIGGEKAWRDEHNADDQTQSENIKEEKKEKKNEKHILYVGVGAMSGGTEKNVSAVRAASEEFVSGAACLSGVGARSVSAMMAATEKNVSAVSGVGLSVSAVSGVSSRSVSAVRAASEEFVSGAARVSGVGARSVSAVMAASEKNVSGVSAATTGAVSVKCVKDVSGVGVSGVSPATAGTVSVKSEKDVSGMGARSVSAVSGGSGKNTSGVGVSAVSGAGASSVSGVSAATAGAASVKGRRIVSGAACMSGAARGKDVSAVTAGAVSAKSEKDVSGVSAATADAVSAKSEKDVSGVSAATAGAVSAKSEKDMSAASVSDVSGVRVSEKNVSTESEASERSVSVVSGARGSHVSTRDTCTAGVRAENLGTKGSVARGRASHVRLQGGSDGSIPLFPLDEDTVDALPLESHARVTNPAMAVTSGKDSDATATDPVMASGRDARESKAHTPGLPDPWPDEGLEDGEHQDFGTRKALEAGKQYTTVRRAGWETDGTTENTRFVRVENRRREFEKRREWEFGEPMGVWPEWPIRMGGGDGLDEASRKDSDVMVVDPATAYGRDPTESEAYVPGRPDPWPDEGLEDGEHQDGNPGEPEAAIWERYQESDWFRDMAKHDLLEERIRRLLAAEPSKEWDQVLLRATRALNTREVRVHGYSPFQLLFGIPPHLNLPGDNPLLSEIHGNAALLIRLDGIRATLQSTEQGPVEEVLWAEAEREEVREEARQCWQVYAERMVVQTSRNLVKPGPIRPGDLVMLRDTAVAKEKGLKFYYQWTGPYLVRSVTREEMSFVLQHPDEDKALYGTHHRDDVRLWTVRPEHLRYPSGAPIQPEFPMNIRQ